MATEKLTVPSGSHRLAALFHTPSGEGPFPAVVVLHGLLSSKSSRKYALLADIAVAWGLALVRFDFRAMGESTGERGDITLSGRLEDARAVVDFLKGHPAVDGERLGLMGSSLGGVVAWATALAEPAVRATAVWATPCHLRDLMARRGQPGPSGSEPLPEAFFYDLEGHDLMELPGGLERVLIVHGEADELVPVEHAYRLYARAADPKRMIILPGVDHRITDEDHRKRSAESTIHWLASHLG